MGSLGTVFVDVKLDEAQVKAEASKAGKTISAGMSQDAAASGTRTVRTFGESGQKEAETQAGKIRDTLKRGFEFGAAFYGGEAVFRGVTEGIKTVVESADQLKESSERVDRVFGESSGSVLQFGKDAAQSYGLSAAAADQMSVKLGALLTNLRLPQDEAAKMSVQLIKLSADLAAFNHTDSASAEQALQSALAGRTQGLKQYGIVVDAASVQQQALKDGLIKTVKDGLDPAAKAQATYEVILQRSGVQQGAFARGSNSLAEQTQILKAEATNAGAAIGQRLIPVLVDGAKALDAGGQAASRYGKEILDVGLAFGAWKLAGAIPSAIEGISSGLTTLTGKAAAARASLAELGGGSALLGSALAGGTAAGLLVVANGLTSYISGMRQASQFTGELRGELDKSPSSLKAYNDALEQVDNKIAQLRSSVGGGDFLHGFLGAFTGSSESFLAQIGPLQRFQNQLENQRAQINGTIDTIAEKITTLGSVTGSRNFASNLSLVTNLSNQGFLKLSDGIQANIDKVKTYSATVLNGTPAQRAEASLLSTQANNASTAADKINVLVTAMQSLAGENQSLLGDQISAAAAIGDLANNIDKSSRSLDVNTDAGRTNLTAINQAATAIEKFSEEQVKAGVAPAKVNQQMTLQALALENQAVKAGFSKQQIDALIQSLLKQPKATATNVSTPGADSSKKKVDDLHTALGKLPKGVSIDLEAVDRATKQLGDVSEAIRAVISGVTSFDDTFGSGRGNATRWDQFGGKAHGGLIDGPGTGTSDTAGIFRLSKGETVVPAHLTQKYAPLFAMDGIPGFAQGGLIGYDGAAMGDFTRMMFDTTNASQLVVNDAQPYAQMAQAMSFGGGSGAGAQQWAPLVAQVLAMFGLNTPENIAKWLRQITSESGGNASIVQGVHDINSGGNEAVGLVQVTPGTFNDYAGPFVGLGRTNPLANLYAGMNWDLHKSQAPFADIGFGHGYDDGGVWKSGTAGWNTSGNDEYVITHADMGEAVALLRQLVKLTAKQPGAIVGGLNGTARNARLDSRTRTR